MRPRHKAAENNRNGFPAFFADLASMRPRHKAAENFDGGVVRPATVHGFNEAAA